MSDLAQRIADLSPDKRALLTLRLKKGKAADAKKQAIPRRADRDTFPLSFSQQRLWFLDQLEPGSSFYNIPAAVRLTGPLNATALRQSLNRIVRRHEVLCATYTSVNGQPIQNIAPELALPLPIVDLQHLPKDAREEEAIRLATQEAHQPFDLVQGPLIRTQLLRLDPEDHILLLTIHHIVFDGWSTEVFVRELGALYESFAAGRPSALPELPIQYTDYAHWQRQWLQGEVLESQLAYWKQQLGDSPPVLELPTDHPRPPTQTYRGAHHTFELSKHLYEDLKDLSQREGVTLFMTLLAAFQTLLYRYTGQEDICVGTPIANRRHPEIEELIGFFVNTLVIHTELSASSTFRELLQRVREVTLEAYAHQDLPFEMLVDMIQPERSMSYTPLFQVMLVLQTTPLEALQLGNLQATLLEVETEIAKFDLMLTIEEGADRSKGGIEYNTDLFDPPTIQRMAGHFVALLEGIAIDPDQSISRLPLLTTAEWHQMLVEWNDTHTDDPLDQTIHHLVEAQVARTPAAVALVSERQRLTYQQLDRRANQLAHHLRALGVGPEALVGMCMERSPDMVVALLAILKAGGAYVPLDPNYPQERLAFMISDAQVSVLLTQQHLLEHLPEPLFPTPYSLLLLDADWPTIAQRSEARPASTASARNLAYVLFTSGSTGRPKGVAIEHRSAAALIHWAQRVFPPRDLAGVLASTSISFDLSVFELFMTLSCGGTVILAENALQLPDLPAASEVKLINTVPSAITQLLRSDSIPTSVSTINLAGEPLTARLADQLYQGSSAQRVFDLYGPSEDTTYSTFALRHPGGMATIGRPIANSTIYLLDSNLQPVPIGVPGELYIGGAGLARGYLNRPDSTADRFIPDPFSDEPGARLYRTGDLVRYWPDGNVEFLGRIDHQVKIRGFRIELGEIETVLKAHPEIRDAVTLAREDVPGEKQLVAYTVPEEGMSPSVGTLRRFLQDKLPAYMVPSAFVMLEALPLTPNGKLNRRALPAPGPSRPELDATYVVPRTPVQEMLAGIWTQILTIDQVGIYDNFFELGGHSLLATQVMARISDAFQVELPLRAIFERPTVAGLAEKIETVQRTAHGLSIPPIEPAPREREMPLSFAQQRLWFLDQLEPGSPLYNVASAVRLTGPLNMIALEQSLNEIVRRHEELRTAFATVDGKPVRVISSELTVPLPVVDLTYLSGTDREAEALRQAIEDARRPFELDRVPLIRATLLRLSEEDHVVLLTMHHIVSDGWSVGVFTREMAALYEAFSAGKPSPLPELAIQYADFAHWQRRWLQGDVLESQLAYWKQQLEGLTPLLELPTDRPRPAVQTFQGAIQWFELPREIIERLEALGRQEGATLFMTLLAAFQTLLYRYTGQEDVSVGTPIANRNRPEIEGLIGFFVNTLVMSTHFSANPTFRELLEQVREMSLGAYAHQDLPFEMLVDALQPERALSHSPLFQVMFAMQDTSMEAAELPSLTLTPIEVDAGTSKFDLTLFILEREGSMRGMVEYNTDLFDASTIERFSAHFQRLLEGIVADPDQPVSRLPLLTETEQHLVLVEWTNTRTDDLLDRCIHHLVEDQVSHTPDAVALVFERQQLTYRELDARTNQMARYLQTMGVGPGVLVGVCMDRSPEMVVAQLGILKAGGAYVPIDPNYPQERVSFMMEDAQVSVLLTMGRLRDILPEPMAQVICVDDDWDEISRESDTTPDSGATARDLAYVLFTSGSTGKPKGVAIEHRSAVGLIQWARQVFAPEDLAGTLASTSISFDLSVFELFLTLSCGGTVILAENALQLPHLPAANRVTLINTVPSAITELLRIDGIPDSVHTVNLAGEPLLAHVVDQLYERPSVRRVYDLYGPSEDTTYSTFALRRMGGPEVIGRPIDNTQAYVLDANLEPVPIGVQGKLYLGGAGLARGYLSRPQMTAERFIPDPFSDQPGARMYRTGDLVRYCPDGDLVFLGRMDYQVKIRGFRIELGEIMTALREHPDLKEVVVLAREDTPGEKRLVAYVVPEHEQAPSVSEMRAFLRQTLPEYMVPATFVTLDAMPLTPNGKVNRRALPAPDQSRPDLEAAYVAPRTQEEKILTGIWAQTLGIEQVGVHDNFFELGGDSILSIQVIASANQAGLRLIPRQIFQYPTVAGLAVVASSGPVIEAEQGIVEGSVPLTPIQRWFFEQELPDPHHWNQAVLLEVQQTLDPSWLEAAVRHLLEHHDALRLRFDRGEVGWEQTNVGMVEDIPFSWIDLSSLPQDEQGQTIESRAAELQASLDIAAGPLLQMAYFDLGTGRSDRLLMVIHHLAIDGVSWRIMLEDFQTAYRQLSLGEAVQLPPKTTSFQRWAQRMREYAQTEALREESPHWLAVSQNGVALLPVDHAGGTNTEASARSVWVSLTEEETQALLQEVPAAYGTEINDALLTALAQAMAEWTSSQTVFVDVEGHGREDIWEDVDTSRTVGWFTTMFPVLLDLRDAHGSGAALKTVKEQLRRVPRRGIGYDLLRYLGTDEEIAGQLRARPRPEVVFNYLGRFDQTLAEGSPFRLAPESAGPERSLQGKRSHLLSISGSIVRNRLQMEWSYSEAMYRRETVERIADAFVEALRAIIAHCQSPEAGGYTPSDFPDIELSQEEIEDLMAEIGEAM